jgi:hypothetical protein
VRWVVRVGGLAGGVILFVVVEMENDDGEGGASPFDLHASPWPFGATKPFENRVSVKAGPPVSCKLFPRTPQMGTDFARACTLGASRPARITTASMSSNKLLQWPVTTSCGCRLLFSDDGASCRYCDGQSDAVTVVGMALTRCRRRTPRVLVVDDGARSRWVPHSDQRARMR